MLIEKSELFYLKITEIISIINLEKINKKFDIEKKKWKKKIEEETENFFFDTDLILINKDFIILKTIDKDHSCFLLKKYRLKHQNFIKKFFLEEKNIILVSEKQFKEKNNNENVFILFKNEKIIKEKTKKWIEFFLNYYK